MAFLLAGAPYHYGDLTIGLFGLVGAAGALCANVAGSMGRPGLVHDDDPRLRPLRGRVLPAPVVGRARSPLADRRHPGLDVGVQGLQVTNQSLIYRLAPDARSRVNSAYMVCYFAGGAIGSAVGGALYSSHRWAGVCILGAGIGVAAVVAALVDAYRADSRARRQGSRSSAG